MKAHEEIITLDQIEYILDKINECRACECDECKVDGFDIDEWKCILFEVLPKYIKQQEKKDKLLELYQEKEKLSKNPYKNIDTKEMKPYFEWACELVALEEKIKALEEEMK